MRLPSVLVKMSIHSWLPTVTSRSESMLKHVRAALLCKRHDDAGICTYARCKRMSLELGTPMGTHYCCADSIQMQAVHTDIVSLRPTADAAQCAERTHRKLRTIIPCHEYCTMPDESLRSMTKTHNLMPKRLTSSGLLLRRHHRDAGYGQGPVLLRLATDAAQHRKQTPQAAKD